MSTLLEANRPRFTFQVGGQSFRVRKFQGREMISRLFLFELDLVSDDPEINFDSILNQPGLLKLQQYQDYDPRYVHGLVNHFEQRNEDGNYTNYYATLVPQVWLLTQRHDCRIFQQMDVQKIIDKVLKEAGIPSDFYRFDLMKSHEKREYCVQYRETDWNFISRLLEEEGIFGYFEHSESKHTLVMPDHSYSHPPIPSPDTVIFHNPSGYAANEEHLYFFHYAERLSSGKVTLRDFNFKRPSMDLEVNKTADKETQLEVYDYPGLYEYDGPGQDRAKVRLEGLQALRKLGFGESTCVRFLPGHQFTLERHPRRDVNRTYLITAVTQEGEQPQVLKEQASGEGTKYHSQVQAVPADVSYRPLRFTPKPMVEGPQTAIVVGPKGEEIYVDEHGRVKVQFHWDRLGKKDEKSSCWIRVSQVWAGQSWGGVFIPRIGQEVIVDFLEGDPDRPIITGRVYHGENRPPYSPPQNKTKSTIKSNSSPGGGGFNELRFEDLKGQEEVYLQAEKDWNILVKNDKNQQIGHNETLAVGNNRTKTVGVNQSETIGANKTIQVGENHQETIKGNQMVTVLQAAAETIGLAKALSVGAAYQITVGAAMNTTVALSQSEEVGLLKKVMVGKEISFTCGKSSFILKKDGTILLKGVKIDIEGCGPVTIKGVPIHLNPDKAEDSGEASNEECTKEGHPVDVATGRLFTTAKDFTLAGPLPVTLVRTYDSSRLDRGGIFGAGWFSLLDLQVEIEASRILFQDAEGRLVKFPLVAVGESFFNGSDKLTLVRSVDRVQIRTQQKLSYEFTLDSSGSKGVLSAISDANHHSVSLAYDQNGKLILKDAAGKLYRLEYDKYNRLVGIYSEVKSLQKEVRLRRYQYDEWNRLVAVYDESAKPSYYTYDTQNRLTKETDRNGYSFFFEYDSTGRCVKTWGQDGLFHRELTYLPVEQKTEVVYSQGQKTTYYYNEAGLVTTIINPANGFKHLAYDDHRNLIMEVDENQNMRRYEYDDQGRLIARIDAANNEWKTELTDEALIEVDPLGNRVTQRWDAQGNLVRQDAAGNQQVSLPSREAYVQQREYDDWGRLTAVQDKLGHTTRYDYDLKGNLVAVTDKRGHRTALGYDAEDNLIWVQDPLGYRRYWVYQGFGQLVEQRDENGHLVKLGYDAENNLTSIVNENQEQHVFKYDALDRLVEDTGFDGHLRQYEYDAAGRITRIKHADGSVLVVDYDKTGKIVAVQGTDEKGNKSRSSYRYDVVGRLVEARNEHSVVTFEYDALGRMVKESQGDFVIEREYDAAGNYASRHTTWGNRVQFCYDENQRLSEVVLPGEKVIRSVRNAIGQPTEEHFPGGTSSHCVHDALGNLLSQELRHEGNSLLKREYQYSSRNQLLQVEDSRRGTQKRYDYDKAGRLTKVTHANGRREEFVYDAAGNVCTSGGRPAKYTHGNRLVAFGHNRYEWDARGNLIRKTTGQGAFRYRYNVFNQLIGCETPSGERVEFRYDALGRRIAKNSGGKEVRFYWDRLQLLGETGKDKPVEYVFHPNHFVPMALLENGQVYFYHTDHLGTPLEMTDERGGMVWMGDYETWGRCRVQGKPVVGNPFRFQGQYSDVETGLHYNMFRYYDAEVGRYISEDPIGYLSGDFNLYRYVQNNPINRVDGLGLTTVLERTATATVLERTATATAVTAAETFNAEAALAALGRTGATVVAGGAGFATCGPPCAAGLAALALLIFGSSPVEAPTLSETDNTPAKQKKDCKTGSGGSGGGNKPPPKKTGSSPDDEPPQNKKVENSNKEDKVRTPDTHPKDFTKLKSNQGYRNNNTNESWQRSHTSHKGDVWKVYRGGTRVGSVRADGSIAGK